MSGTLDVKGGDKWAVYLLELRGTKVSLVPGRQSARNRKRTDLVYFSTQKLFLKVTAHHSQVLFHSCICLFLNGSILAKARCCILI